MLDRAGARPNRQSLAVHGGGKTCQCGGDGHARSVMHSPDNAATAQLAIPNSLT
jgi:hypothetical protein